MADGEDHFFLMADYAKDVIDIREQFPLFPEECTQAIARHLGIRHPRYPHSKIPLVMTTDFLLTVIDATGHRSYRAISVKRAADLNGKRRKRILEKLEIERRYWQMRSVPWHLITNHDFDETMVTNLEWLHYVAVEHDFGASSIEIYIAPFIAALRAASQEGTPLKQILHACAASLGGIDTEFVYQLFRHCAWHHFIELDLTTLIGPRYTPKILAYANDTALHALKGVRHEYRRVS
ncbi:MAG TPA: TnsA endonuclease N-terminal domain-containing protein [Noviherbaspirillum sp.]|nr:TnsA endonuclease N-terminal domain-containing protein [Noviherbaspirillum sp.]